MADHIDLAPEFAAAWKGRDPFEAVSELEGEVFRKVKSRRTFRFEFGGNGYFAKIHHGVGWREIIKNWLMRRTSTTRLRCCTGSAWIR